MGNPFETNLKGVKIDRSGNVPSLEFGYKPSSLEERYQTNLSIFTDVDNRLGQLDSEIDKLDKEGLMESIKRDVKEAEDRVNKKSTGEKIAQWTSLATTGLSALSAFSAMKGAKGVTSAAAAQAGAKTTDTDYSKASDADLTSKLNEYTKKKTDAQKIIDEQTPVSRAQQKIIDDINANTHEECKKLQTLEADVAKLDLEKGEDPLVVTYKETSANLDEANKGAEGSLPECQALKIANAALETAKTTKLYKDQTDPTTGKVTKVEDTEAEQREIKKAQEEVEKKQKALNDKKTELERKKEADLQAINKEKTKREGLVTKQTEKIATTKSDAQKKNGEACTKIGKATDEITAADAQIKLIQAEQSKRATKKK